MRPTWDDERPKLIRTEKQRTPEAHQILHLKNKPKAPKSSHDPRDLIDQEVVIRQALRRGFGRYVGKSGRVVSLHGGVQPVIQVGNDSMLGGVDVLWAKKEQETHLIVGPYGAL